MDKFVILTIAGAFAAFLVIAETRIRRFNRAVDLHNLMFDQYVKLCENSAMTVKLWEDLLPTFDAIDEICAKDCPEMKYAPIGFRIRSIIYSNELTPKELADN